MLKLKYDDQHQLNPLVNILSKREIVPDIHRIPLPYETARNICIDEAKQLKKSEKKPILDSLGRILSEDIVSRYYNPPFDKSMMDGYAVKEIDVMTAQEHTPVCLKVVGFSQQRYYPYQS